MSSDDPGHDCTVGRRGCDGPGTYRCDEVVWGSPCRAWQARNGGYVAPDGHESADPTPAELLAQRFHEAYERLAPEYSYRTREASAVPWRSVPVRNRRLMIATAQALLDTSPLVIVDGRGAALAYADTGPQPEPGPIVAAEPSA